MKTQSILFAICALLCVPFVMAQEKAAAADVLLRVSAAGIQEFSLNRSAFTKLPRSKVEVDGGDGKRQIYEGTSLLKVLELAGAPTGGKLKGKSVATYVVARAKDGYKALFAIE